MDMKNVIAVASILAGLIHGSYVAVEHWTEFPPLEFAFFISVGIAQVIWGILFLKKPSTSKHYFGLFLNGGVFVTWLLTRYVDAPFQETVEGIGFVDSFVGLLELIAIFGSVYWVALNKKLKLGKAMASGLVLVIVSGALMYGSSMGMEKIFPDRVFVHSHGDEDGHHSDEDDHHDEKEMHDEKEDVRMGSTKTDDAAEMPHDDSDDHHDDGDNH